MRGYVQRNGRRCGHYGNHKAAVEADIVSELKLAGSGAVLVLLDDCALRGLRSLSGRLCAANGPFDVWVIEHTPSTAAAQMRILETWRRPKQLQNVKVVCADVHRWIATADLQQAVVWLDLETSSLPAMTLRRLALARAGWCTLSSRGRTSFSERFATYRKILSRICAVGGYQRPKGMVMYNFKFGQVDVTDAEVFYEVRTVRPFVAASGCRAIQLHWWGFPKKKDQYAYYVRSLEKYRVHPDGATVTVQLPGQTQAFTARLQL